MTLPVFVVTAEALAADPIELVGDEGRHAVVKRIRVGERIMLTDGQGNGAKCLVHATSKTGLVVTVLVRRLEPAAVPRLVVVQAIPKGDHADRAVDLLTEVGVDRIVPWAASRNIVTWKGSREDTALTRWRATARAAAKQSRRLRFPEVSALHTTQQVAELIDAAQARTSVELGQPGHRGLALVLCESVDQPVSGFDLPEQGDVLLVVGPEGGITDDEMSVFTAAGAHAVRLGPTVLRSSTAGAVASAVLLSRTPRWR